MPTTNNTLGPAATLLEAQQASVVIDAAGQWLADQQALEGCTWVKSRRVLESRRGSRRETVTVERSYQDRAHRAVTFRAAAITVTDTVLRAWRRDNPQRILVRPASVEGIVCSAGLLDFGAGSSVNLADPDKRLSRLEMVLAHLRAHAVPWFAATATPGMLPSSVPESLLCPWGFAADMVEYLAVHDHQDDARELIHRVLAQGQEHQAAFDEGRDLANQHARPHWHSAPSLGWTATSLDLA